jgi:predicted TIM-barrel fold metal-dependent hydrolase
MKLPISGAIDCDLHPTLPGVPALRRYLDEFANRHIDQLPSEGVFQKFPRLRVVRIESGFTWLPTWLWRTNKDRSRGACGSPLDRPGP